MRSRLLISIIGILVVAVALAGLLGELDSLTNPIDTKNAIPLENGLLQSRGGGISGVGLAVKGPVHLSEDPVLKVSGATGISYLRVIAGETYTGDSWLPSQSPDISQNIPSGADIAMPSIRDSNNYSSAQVSVSPILPLGQGPIAISLYTTKPQGSNAFSFHSASYAMTDADDLKNGYSFQALSPVFSPDELRNAKTVVVTPSLLQLPDTLPQRVKDLAADITRGKTNDYDKLEAIITYLQQYTYDLDNAPIPPGRDGVDFFLFDDKRGVCCTFSSSFVVLARAVGIPARVVGGWAIAPVGTEQVVKAKQAHQWAEVPFSGLGWVTFEATPGGYGPCSRVASQNLAPESTITEITSVDTVINKGKTFNVVGKVTTVSGSPVDGLSVELFINLHKETTGGVLVGKGTVTQGTFNITALIPDSSALGDYQLMAQSIGIGKYKESWSDPQIKVVTDTMLTLTVPQRVQESEPVTLQGKLVAQDSSPIPGQTIDVFVDGVLVNQLTTGANGQFQGEQTFNKPGQITIEVKFPGADYQLPSSGKANVMILIPTIMNLQVQSKARVKDLVVTKGTLIEDKTLIPVKNQQIGLTINGQPLGDKLTTDRDGVFTLEHKFTKSGNYQIEASFAGDPTYWETSAKAKLEVTASSQRIPIWIFAVIAVAIGLIIATGFALVRRRKRRTLVTEQSDIQPTTILKVVPIKEKPHGISLNIEFPLINGVFPDVWGIGDELEIFCVLLDPNGNAMDTKRLEINIGSKMLEAITDKSGTAKLRYTFKQKGEYLVKAKLSGEARGENIKGERMLRIVDYREEIVSLFKNLTGWLLDFGVSFAPQATPREIQRATLRAKEELPAASLETTVSYFEEADFSIHDINRNTYEQMYLEQKKITQYERKETNN